MSEVRYERDGRIGYITLDRPEKLNALTDDGILDLRRACEAFDDDPDAWVAIIHGEGRAFSSGADVQQRQNRTPEEIRALGGLARRGASIKDSFSGQMHNKPVVAAMHGFVLGAALRLALHCDLLVASEGTQFQVTEVPRGIDAAPFWLLLADRVGTAFADDVCITGRRWLAEEASERGLLARLAPAGDHLAVARQVADQVLENPPLAVRAIVRNRRSRIDQVEATGRIQADRSLFQSADFRESVQAFLGKRKAQYRGE
jgi:enoyl-CoA hydratase/carnithine racemase